MGRFLAGSVAALLLVAAGLFWWQDRADSARSPLIAVPAPRAPTPDMPLAHDPNAVGKAPPLPPSADPLSREQRRFARYDHDRDGIITRKEMMASRSKAFRKLDKDGNNLLSFEEWAVRTSDRFEGADANRDNKLTASEFATTAPKRRAPKASAKCACGD